MINDFNAFQEVWATLDFPVGKARNFLGRPILRRQTLVASSSC
jgi:hypothetical protein